MTGQPQGVFPTPPNWSGSYTETYSFSTEILTSRVQKEQRRALRQSPRRTIAFDVMAAGEGLRALKRFFAQHQAELTYLPDLTKGVAISAPSAVGANTVSIDVPVWATPGAVVTISGADRTELRTIATVGSGLVTFAEVNAQDWLAGAVLAPALSVRSSIEGALTRRTTHVVTGSLSFAVDPGSEPPIVPAAAPATWSGREVLLLRPNWAGSTDLTFVRQTETVDYGFGRVESWQPAAFGVEVRVGDFLAADRTQARAILDFFVRVRGRQGEFYAPTDEPDIAPSTNIAGGTASFVVKGADFLAAYGGSTVFKTISFLLADGRRFFRNVASIEAAGGDTRINLSAVVPYAIPLDSIAAISWMPVCRLASDDLTIEWLTDQVAQARLNFMTLEDLPVEGGA